LLKNKEEIINNRYNNKILSDGSKLFEGRDNNISSVKARIEDFENLFKTYTD
jgi:hypothetical protein